MEADRDDTLQTLRLAAERRQWHAEHRKYSHQEVVAAQQALGIPSDGVIGPKTSLALVLFQERIGANEVDGCLGPETFRGLAEEYKAGNIPLEKEELVCLDQRIRDQEMAHDSSYRDWLSILFNRKKGYPASLIEKIQETVGSSPDGIFGFDTIRKLREWQKSHRLLADGKVGIQTLKAMGLHEKEIPKPTNPFPGGPT